MIDFADWDDEIKDDLDPTTFDDLVVFSRDWTVQTIFNQIEQGNIDLDPKFQRRNAWTDMRRSLLIESLILGIPVPEIVLAESRTEKRKYLVLDGKQRLLAIAGFMDRDLNSWDDPHLANLKIRMDLNGKSYSDIQGSSLTDGAFTEFINADIRCTVLSNYKSDDVLYNIFYRLNTGSVPLSTQELRQVLQKGPFAEYLVTATNENHPIHQYLNLVEPDPRFRDVELLLRYIGLQLFPQKYRGNLKQFLDLTMYNGNQSWKQLKDQIKSIDATLAPATSLLNKMFKGTEFVGRKFVEHNWESRFNKAVFDVELFYASHLADRHLPKNKVNSFKAAFERFCTRDESFIRSIEVTTKSLEEIFPKVVDGRDRLSGEFRSIFEDHSGDHLRQQHAAVEFSPMRLS